MCQNRVWSWNKTITKKPKSIRSLFKLKKKNETIKDRLIRDIRTLFRQEDHYYKPIRVTNFWNMDYIKYQSSADRNKNYQ